jgi:hypothetical protein
MLCKSLAAHEQSIRLSVFYCSASLLETYAFQTWTTESPGHSLAETTAQRRYILCERRALIGFWMDAINAGDEPADS